MSTFVIRGDKTLFVAHHSSTPLRSGHHSIHSFIKELVGDFCCVLTSCQKCCLVENVGEVGSGETGSFPRKYCQVHTLRHGLTFGVNFQNLLATLHVRCIHLNLAIKTTGAQQCWVQNVRPVGRGNQNNVRLGVKTVHLHQKLVEGLLTLIVASAHASPTVTPHRIDLINEDDGGCIFLGLSKEVSHARRSHTDKHLDEVRTRNGIERDIGFACHGPRQQSLAGSRRAIEKNTLRDAGTDLLELLGILQELLDFVELLDGFIRPRHILERDRGSFLRHKLCP